jgi:hypothetical protein
VRKSTSGFGLKSQSPTIRNNACCGRTARAETEIPVDIKLVLHLLERGPSKMGGRCVCGIWCGSRRRLRRHRCGRGQGGSPYLSGGAGRHDRIRGIGFGRSIVKIKIPLDRSLGPGLLLAVGTFRAAGTIVGALTRSGRVGDEGAAGRFHSG